MVLKILQMIHYAPCDMFLCDTQIGCVAIPKANCPEPNQC
ncbi:hypothetical protein DDB_G0272086 [Dictyostelium discoideum AX4]|uniref:Uncharacterized protein n=1 Tax=Dictyostelium discoideum TaxID=44689 RepID=Q55A72_DICDI|nr:hypothetical protein DDB_G0272086 [Dictyostelium discoideum AX4]EAL71404.1 hypothetical protein DDB_G0272086 [Dictyostelium discoideum AX4]|eukprot:XP_645321.1 hypothetical protein DDB_G0272086 [Dictyostelium discoideum AX4]